MAYMNKDRSDMKLFKNRLLELMDRKGISSAKDLAKQLHRDGLVSVNHRQDDMNPFDKEKNAIGSIEKRIQSHLNANTPDKLQGEYARAYCVFFGCSYDYLFGVDEIPNKTVKTIHDKTGLSEKAITKLTKMNRVQTDMISRLLEHKDIIGAVNQMYELSDKESVNASQADMIVSHVLKRMSDDNAKTIPIHGNMVEKAMLYSISTMLTNIVTDITETALQCQF